jgi:catechol 2,3-dioxygenase-like lactoylglutathione lyase family enzyme
MTFSDETEVVICSCCGSDRDPETMAALQCHDDIKICRDCIGWLGQRAGIPDVTPTLPVAVMPEAIAFYEAAGFEVESYDGGFAFVRYAEASVFDLALRDGLDPATNGAGCYIITSDADQWHQRLSAAGLPVTPIADEPWGMHEFTLTDPSGNHLRIGRNV